MYCQKCRTPLKLDGSLESLNPAAFDLLIGSVNVLPAGNRYNQLMNATCRLCR